MQGKTNQRPGGGVIRGVATPGVPLICLIGRGSVEPVIPRDPMQRALWLVLVLSGLAVAVWALANLARPKEAPRNPNLVIITIDTVRADFLGAYGYPELVTPNLDALAKQSIIFNRAYSTAPRTSPSHASIFTSRLPSEHSVIFNGIDMPGKIDASLPILAGHLKDAGFATAAVVSAPPVGHRHGFSRGFRFFHEVFDRTYVTVKGKRYKLDDGGRGDLVSASAGRWLEEHGHERFFLWAHYFDAHMPYHCIPDVYRELGLKHAYVSHSVAKKLQPPELRQYYRADVYEMDKNVGLLLASLRKLDLLPHTVIAVVADHGEYLKEHGMLAHTPLYDEVLHVPMFIYRPGMEAAVRRSDVVSTVDLAPTLLGLLGAKPLPGARGRDLLAPGAQDRPVPVFAEWWWHKPFLGKSTVRPSDILLSVQLGTDKLIRDRVFPQVSKLFNLKNDPEENNNLFKSDPETARRLEKILRERIGGTLDMEAGSIEQLSLDRDTLKMLKELGYLQ